MEILLYSMKVGALNSYNTKYNQKNVNNKSFKARVNVLESATDVLSCDIVYLNKEPLKTLVDKIVPVLKKLDDNLIIDVSGVSDPLTFWSIFKRNHSLGLKFDLKFFDIKKFYYKLMKDDLVLSMLNKEIYNGLKNKDVTLLDQCLTDSVGVGKFYYPKKGETPQQYIDAVIPKIKEHARLLPKFTLIRKDLEFSPENNCFYRVCGVYNIGSRMPWNKYRGIEFDYPHNPDLVK